MSNDNSIHGLLAKFSGPDTVLKAVKAIHKAGYQQFDSYTPFPVHGMDKAMGLGRSPLGYMIGTAGGLGMISITLFIYWVSVMENPFVISGKELFSFQAFVPPIFAITILASAITATLGMISLNKLPKLYNPLFESESFAKVTDDGFFVCIEAIDSKFDHEETSELLNSLGALSVEVVEL